MRIRLLLLLMICPLALLADVQVPALISDNMVLQQKSANVWGKASPGEKVTVRIGPKKFETAADNDGKWAVKVASSLLKPGEPYEMTISGSNVVTVHNVVLGEVWVCSGQSNMEWSVANSRNANEEIASANHPMIRFFTVARNASNDPQEECVGKWVVCSAETVAPFSAVGYFFARELSGKLKEPVGMIHSSWGGTPAQAWTPKSALEADAELKPIIENWQKAVESYPALKQSYDTELAAWKKASEEAIAAGQIPAAAPKAPKDLTDSPVRPTALYNGMIAPLLPYTIKGVIWYQGESNVPEPKLYGKLFPALINSWRDGWGNANLPFYYVQLPNFGAKSAEPSAGDWALLREAQSMTLKVPHTGMAVTIDIGEEKSVHPKNKQEVGKRLAAIALAKTYSMDKVVSSCPTFAALEIDGTNAMVRFTNADSGLVAKNGEPLKGFAVAGEDKVFHWASAKIKDKTVILNCPEVTKPVAVRYAWGDNPDCDLVNKAGLPAAPFRTDAWE